MKAHYCQVSGHVRIYGDDVVDGEEAYDDRISFLGIVTVQWLARDHVYISGGLGKMHIGAIANEIAKFGATKIEYEHKGKRRVMKIQGKSSE